MFPLHFHDIEECTKEGSNIMSHQHLNDPQKINCFDAVIEPILLASCFTESVDTDGDDEVYFRNGRWTNAEVDYIKFLRELFDSGALPLPQGIKLSDFLRRLLLCKSSRLRKKLKLSNFCKRKYLMARAPKAVTLDCEKLSKLEEHFLDSLETDAARRVLRFNFSRMWGKYLWTACDQLNLKILDSKEWYASLEDIERRAKVVKEEILKERFSNNSVLFDGERINLVGPLNETEVNQPGKVDSMNHLPISLARSFIINSIQAATLDDEDEDEELTIDQTANPLKPSPRLAINQASSPKVRPRDSENKTNQGPVDDFNLTSDDLDALLSEETNSCSIECKRVRRAQDSASDLAGLCETLSDWTPFLDKVSSFVDEENLPFDYFDLWVAKDESKNNEGESKEQTQIVFRSAPENGIRLCHVGHGLKGNVESIWTIYHMTQFGSYSETFSFPPGIGLPGRAFSTGVPIWDDGIQHSSLKNFPRVSGAQKHGVKNALGIPISCNTGRFVVALYTSQDIRNHFTVIQRCWNEFSKFNPQPTMKFLTDSISSTKGNTPAGCTVKSSSRRESFSSVDPSSNSEGKILNLITNFMPLSDIDSKEKDAVKSQRFMALRLFLLRQPSSRTINEEQILEVLKRSHQSYINVKKKDSDIATLLVNDFHMMNSTLTLSSMGNLPPPMTSSQDLKVDFLDHNVPTAQTSIEYRMETDVSSALQRPFFHQNVNSSSTQF